MNWSYFIAGCIGAVAPEVVRLYNVRNDDGLKFRAYYFAISVAYILLGGYVASIFPGLTGNFYAFCIGAGLVLVVNKVSEIAAALMEGARGAASGRPSEPIAKTDDGLSNVEPGGFKRRRSSSPVQRPGGLLDFLQKL